MQKNKLNTLIALFLILSFIVSMFAVLPINQGQIVKVADRPTTAYIDVHPATIGITQTLLVNLWIYPPPAGPNYEGGVGPTGLGGYQGYHFHNIKVTFTRPDGSQDTFMPTDGSASVLKLIPGETEEVGTMWFEYKPTKLGNWSVSFAFPGEKYEAANFSVYFQPSNSRTVNFNVQEDPVPVTKDYPLPTAYWERPINAQNREWHQISGDWFDRVGGPGAGTNPNKYSKGPGSAHVLWKAQVSLGGLVGGEWGSLSYPAGGGSPSLIWNGRLFINEVIPGTGTTNMTCYDLRTRKMLWQTSGTISAGQIVPASAGTGMTASEFSGTPTAYLWEYGATAWKRYNAYNGVLNLNIPKTNITGGSPNWALDYNLAYLTRQPSMSAANWNKTIPNRMDYNELMCWNFSKWLAKRGDWVSGLEWRVSMKQPDGTGPGEGGRPSSFNIVNNNLGVITTMGEDKAYFFDLKTGNWSHTRSTGFPVMYTIFSPEGYYMPFDVATLKLYCYDLNTWTVKWSTKVGEDPWGSQVSRWVWGYGNTYMGSYDGYVTCLDTETGQIKWQSYLGDTNEIPWKTRAPRSWLVADEKVYVSTSEHTPTQPRVRDNMVFCFNALTGEQLWNVSGAMALNSIAEGYMLGVNEYDGLQYCFGKGKTSTTVTASPDVSTHGSGVMIKGSVLDLSLASPGTPAVSDKDMNTWMNYMHMQNAVLMNNPPDVKGVDVSLDAIDPNNNYIHIGTATSDSSGNFGFAFTPEVSGTYRIIAEFQGSESYWDSHSTTYLNVEEALATVAPAPPQTLTDFTPMYTTFAAGIISVIIAIAIVGLLMLRKRP